MKRVVGGDNFGLGHTTPCLVLLSGYGVKALRLGGPVKHDTEKIRMPKTVIFLKNVNVLTVFIIDIIVIISIPLADGGVVTRQVGDSTTAPVMWGFVQALWFMAGIAILLYGVRMFLVKIVPASCGIPQKPLPGFHPTLDILTVFPKSPTAVMIGLLASVVTFLVCMGVLTAMGWLALAPPMIMLLFSGSAIRVFGNAMAGWRGAIFGDVFNGLILAFGQWIDWGWYSSTVPELVILTDPDWYTTSWLFLGLGKMFGGLGGIGLWIAGAAALVVTMAALLFIRKCSVLNAEGAEAEEETE